MPRLLEQKKKVAEVASTIFGTDIQSDQVVNEYLVRSIGLGHSPTKNDLISAISIGISSALKQMILKNTQLQIGLRNK